MFVTITKTKESSQSYVETEKFLKSFLPKLRKFPGVTGVYAYYDKENGEGNTIVLWESEDAVKAYWSSELIKEPAEFGKSKNVTITRALYPVSVELP
jgi:heme-degrading monooxygenase HmoA